MDKAWIKAKEELQIEVIAPFSIVLDGHEITAIAFLPNFGSAKGTLLFNIENPDGFSKAMKYGYFCSQLNCESYEKYNQQLFQESLNDLQWCSSKKQPPIWYTGSSWC